MARCTPAPKRAAPAKIAASPEYTGAPQTIARPYFRDHTCGDLFLQRFAPHSARTDFVKFFFFSKNFKLPIDIFRKCDIIINVLRNTAGLCNGSTPDSDSVCEGSNPSPAAKEEVIATQWLPLFSYCRRTSPRSSRRCFSAPPSSFIENFFLLPVLPCAILTLEG